MPQPLTILCMATYEKGQEFIRECRRQGCRVLLLTNDKLMDADWPRDSIDETFYIPRDISRDDLIRAVSYVARRERLERIVALDDFDVETAALLREHLRVPGMGDTTARYFRDKLAMRGRARFKGIRVPDFVHVLNDQAIREFSEKVPGPWVLKPRSQAAAIGIKKVHSVDELWQSIERLGDHRSFYVLERFVPGDVFHVDSIVMENRVLFAEAHTYGQPPIDVAHQGGVFTTRSLAAESNIARRLYASNSQVVDALGLVRGVTHTEFILGHADDQVYFLETSARVGGAYIVDVVEAATGINLWREWAKLEIAGEDGGYELPAHRAGYAGIVLSLARQEEPDTSGYNDPEIVRRIRKKNHAGLIVASPDADRVKQLVDDYGTRFAHDFSAMMPIQERPTG
jgi:biotin carboxylase